MVVAGLALLTYAYMSTSFSNLWSCIRLSPKVALTNKSNHKMVQFFVYICVGHGMTHQNGWVGPHQLLPFEVLLTFWYILHKMGKI
jgi:hypothetical protein